MPTRLHRLARRLSGHLGVHGVGLLIIAAIWVLVGLGLVLTPSQTPPDATWHGAIPTEIRLALWWGSALVCIGAAIDTRRPRRDGFALALAVIPPMIRLTSYAWAWVVSFLPGEGGYGLGWYAASIYLALVAIVWLVAAIPDDGTGA